MSKTTDNLVAAFERAEKIRPKVGGFPVLAKVLHEAGVRTNEWFLPSGQSLFVTDLGSAVRQGPPLTDGLLDVAQFDRDAVIRALRADQAGETTLPEFLIAAWRAGVVRYVVDLDARTVTYYGPQGDNYVEAYANVDLAALDGGAA